jgi:Family of unknown function (DUF5677)
MSFATDAFRSPTMERFRASLRNVPAHTARLDFVDELNRFGVSLLRDRDIPRDDRQRLTIAILFIRAHKSFQAGVGLAELGLLSDARAVLRSAAEGAIALNALANDADFLDRMIEAHYLGQRKLARIVLQDPDYRAGYGPEQIGQMETTVREVAAYEKTIAPRTLQDIKWEQVAQTHCRDLYQMIYRLLSGDGTHTNINAIQRHVSFDANQIISELKTGPDIDGLVETLMAACLVFIWAAEPFTRAYPNGENGQTLQRLLRRFTELPQNEPAEARVTPNFEENKSAEASAQRDTREPSKAVAPTVTEALKHALEDVEIAFTQLEFVIKLLSYSELGHIKPEDFDTDHLVKLERGSLHFPIGKFSSQDAIVRAASITVLQAFSATVLVLDKAFEAKGMQPNPEASDAGELLRTLIYMVRCAEAHGLADPRWEVRGRYRRVLKFDIEGEQLSLDLAALDGQPFAIEQIGGYKTWYRLHAVAMRLLRGELTIRGGQEPGYSRRDD